jgi:SHS2 domain-containing protein
VFQFFDHTGDIGVDIDAADPGALFADAACAFSETIADREVLETDEIVEVSLSADAIGSSAGGLAERAGLPLRR